MRAGAGRGNLSLNMPFPRRCPLTTTLVLLALCPVAVARPREDGAYPELVIHETSPPLPKPPPADLWLAFEAPANEKVPGDFDPPVQILRSPDDSSSKTGALRETPNSHWARRVRIRGPPDQVNLGTERPK